METKENKRFTIFLMNCILLQSSPKKRWDGILMIPKIIGHQENTFKQQDSILAPPEYIAIQNTGNIRCFEECGETRSIACCQYKCKMHSHFETIWFSCNKVHTTKGPMVVPLLPLYQEQLKTYIHTNVQKSTMHNLPKQILDQSQCVSTGEKSILEYHTVVQMNYACIQQHELVSKIV